MKYRKQLEFLKYRWTDGLYHDGGGEAHNLYKHLVNTGKLLIQYGRSEDEVNCGLFHSIYGTAYYHRSRGLHIERWEVRNLIGDYAEKLVHAFCNLEKGRKELLTDFYFDEPMLTHLRWVAYCNAIEQGPNSLFAQKLRVLIKAQELKEKYNDF